MDETAERRSYGPSICCLPNDSKSEGNPPASADMDCRPTPYQT